VEALPSWADLSERVEALVEAALARDETRVLSLLRDLVPEFRRA
jgi:hypothetical protein